MKYSGSKIYQNDWIFMELMSSLMYFRPKMKVLHSHRNTYFQRWQDLMIYCEHVILISVLPDQEKSNKVLMQQVFLEKLIFFLILSYTQVCIKRSQCFYTSINFISQEVDYAQLLSESYHPKSLYSFLFTKLYIPSASTIHFDTINYVSPMLYSLQLFY